MYRPSVVTGRLVEQPPGVLSELGKVVDWVGFEVQRSLHPVVQYRRRIHRVAQRALRRDLRQHLPRVVTPADPGPRRAPVLLPGQPGPSRRSPDPAPPRRSPCRGSPSVAVEEVLVALLLALGLADRGRLLARPRAEQVRRSRRSPGAPRSSLGAPCGAGATRRVGARCRPRTVQDFPRDGRDDHAGRVARNWWRPIGVHGSFPQHHRRPVGVELAAHLRPRGCGGLGASRALQARGICTAAGVGYRPVVDDERCVSVPGRGPVTRLVTRTRVVQRRVTRPLRNLWHTKVAARSRSRRRRVPS
jgi:hypothetical protein